jgi:hypothetical protein
MNPDLESAGALISASLVANEIDSTSAGAAAHAHAGPCLNCGAQLSGNYCQLCGQSAHLHRSLWHLCEEFLHGVLHFDAKGFRTLPLLIARPGVLTRRYIDGQRARYVSPMALFLFCIFLMYFVFSLVASGDRPPLSPTGDGAVNAQNTKVATAEMEKARAEVDAEVSKAKAALEAAETSGNGVAAAREALSSANLSKRVLDFSTTAATGALSLSADQSKNDDVKLPDFANWQDKLIEKARPHIHEPGTQGKIYRAMYNPDLTLYKLKNTAYKFSFMLIPISLPFLWLLFIFKRGVVVYDHAIFALYSLSFMSLLFTLCALMAELHLGGAIAIAVIFVPPLHMFLQLRDTYGLGIFSALWRTCALMCVCGTVFLLFLVFIVAMTLH